MSLVAFALRTAMVKALQESPLFGEQICDPSNDPAELPDNSNKPVIVIYPAKDTRSVVGRDLMGAARTLELKAQIYLPASLPVAGVDSAMKGWCGDLVFSLFDRHFERLLTSGSTPWRKILKEIIFGIREVSASPCRIEAQAGHYTTAREYTFKFNTLASPATGSPPEGVWLDVITQLRSEPELSVFADAIAVAIEAPSDPYA